MSRDHLGVGRVLDSLGLGGVVHAGRASLALVGDALEPVVEVPGRAVDGADIAGLLPARREQVGGRLRRRSESMSRTISR